MQNEKSAPSQLWNTNMYYGTTKFKNIICFHLCHTIARAHTIIIMLLNGIHTSYITEVIGSYILDMKTEKGKTKSTVCPPDKAVQSPHYCCLFIYRILGNFRGKIFLLFSWIFL